MIARLLLAASLAAPVCDPADPQRCATPLSFGEAAPFAGQLLSPNLALSLAQQAAGCEERLEAQTTSAAADAAIEVKRLGDLRDLDRASFDRTMRACQHALDLAREEIDAGRPWYGSPWFWAPVAVVGTSVVFGVAMRLTLPASR